jgi:hypothetical protein
MNTTAARRRQRDASWEYLALAARWLDSHGGGRRGDGARLVSRRGAIRTRLSPRSASPGFPSLLLAGVKFDNAAYVSYTLKLSNLLKNRCNYATKPDNTGRLRVLRITCLYWHRLRIHPRRQRRLPWMPRRGRARPLPRVRYRYRQWGKLCRRTDCRNLEPDRAAGSCRSAGSRRRSRPRRAGRTGRTGGTGRISRTDRTGRASGTAGTGWRRSAQPRTG